MTSYYLVKERRGETFAIVLERNNKTDTLKAIRTAINDQYDCYCNLGHIDLNKVAIDNPLTICAMIGTTACNMVVSEARLY